MKMRIDEVIQYLDVLFHSNRKGILPFSTMEKILETQAFFPSLDFENIVYLWKQCELKNLRPDTIAKWQTFKNKGYKIELGNDALKIREYSPAINKFLDRSYFDIAQTDMPLTESRKYKIKQLSFTDNFLKRMYDSFTNNTGYALAQSNSQKFSIDYDNKILYFPLDKEPKTTFISFLKAVTTLQYAPNKSDYNGLLTSEQAAKEANIKIRLTVNAVCPLVGLSPIEISPDVKKQYVWGNTLNDSIASAENTSFLVQSTLKVMDFESNFNQEVAYQESGRRKKFINSASKHEYSKEELQSALKDEYNRLKQEINTRGDMESIVQGYAGNAEIKKIKPNGSEYKTNCFLPGHTEKTPSFNFNEDKKVFHCWGCGCEGDMVKLVMTMDKLGYREAVDKLAKQFGIYSKVEDIIDSFKNPKERVPYKDKFLAAHPELNHDEILNMNEQEFKAFLYDYDKNPDKTKTYTPKVKVEKPEEEKEEKDTRVVKVQPVEHSSEVVTYLAKERGIVVYPPELRYIIGEMTTKNQDGSTYRQEIVGAGYINESGGADIRLPKTFSKEEQWKKTRSVGPKDIIVLNKENLAKDGPKTFIVAESGWDYAAAYNQNKFRNLMADSIGIIANGTSNKIKAIDFINQHKDEETKIIVLTQADEPNLGFTKDLLIKTGVTNYARVEFSDEEFNDKNDVNDLHMKEVDITTRLYGTFTPKIPHNELN